LAIFVADGLRHRQLSGYGALARNLILGLSAIGHDIRLRASERAWESIEQGARERLLALPQVDRESRELADLVLQIRSPPRCSAFAKPTLIYTQNALGDLPPEWIAALEQADGVIVPSEFDRRVFARHLPKVFVAGQSADAMVFKPDATARAEAAPERFSFLYVGSYSFRKGVDLLLEAFLREFSPQEPVELLLHCPGASRKDQLDHFQDTVGRFASHSGVHLSAEERSPEEMCRLYNQSDCVVTLSRGEGWCLPLAEALLCETPVVAPRSTGMVEYLDDSIAELVATRELPASEARSPFAGTFSTVYDHPGVTYYEPSLEQAQGAMRRVYEDRGAASMKAQLGRERILNRFSWSQAVRDVEHACFSLLSDTSRCA
jgi:glycosyltransferase involved in cell wall biosynthesis